MKTNQFKLQENHPIYVFLSMAPSHLKLTLPMTSIGHQQNPISPTLLQIKRESVEIKLEDDLDLPLVAPCSDFTKVKVEEDGFLGVFLPKQERSEPKLEPNDSISSLTLKSEPTEPKLECGFSPIDLTRFSKSPYSPKQEPTPISDIIDLTNSPVRNAVPYSKSSSDSDSSVIVVGTNPKPRPSLQVIGGLKLYAAYSTYEAAEEAVYGAECAKGFPWR